jgi:hypothetical protein
VWLLPVTARATDSLVTGAIREAMQLAVERGLAAVARPEGFVANPVIRLGVPDQLSRVETKMRIAGMDRRVDRFIDSLNIVAEESVAAARPALLAGVAQMPIEEPQRLLAGGETAGTDLLRRVSLAHVISALNPVVGETMGRVGATRRYKRFVRESVVGGLVEPVDLDAYVVGRTAEGLFHAIGEEERRIRTDPAARTTPRLRQVYGRQR